jgi:uncharacterized DUF497 family protein
MDRVFEHGGTSFRWDESKAAENQRNHGVAFEEATTVFDDPLFVLQDASRNEELERRRHWFQLCGPITHGGAHRVRRRIHPNHLSVACLAG